MTIDLSKIDYPLDRFWEKVDLDGPVPSHNPELGNCWLWTGALLDGGYGYFQIGYPGPRHNIRAHRFIYQIKKGHIPDTLVLDHLCRVRRCINFNHLDPVTQKINLLRSDIATSTINLFKTHCPKGHEYLVNNIYIEVNKSGRHRKCKRCKIDRVKRRYQRLKQSECIGNL